MTNTKLNLNALNSVILATAKEAEEKAKEKAKDNPLSVGEIDNNLLRAAVYAAYALSGKKGTLYYKANALEMFNSQRDYVGRPDYEKNVIAIYDALTNVSNALSLPRDSYQVARELIAADPSTAFNKARELKIPSNVIQQAFTDYVKTLQALNG